MLETSFERRSFLSDAPLLRRPLWTGSQGLTVHPLSRFETTPFLKIYFD